MTSRSTHFGALDLYRFIAALGVAMLHFAQFAKYDPKVGFGYAVGDFALLVDFFFILSGFVIGVTYSNRVASFPDIITFLRRRIARIYPLYLLTLLIFAIPAFYGFSRGQFRGSLSVLQDALLVKSWPLHSELPYNFPAWSVSVEWAMYLLFPIIMLSVRRFGNLALACLIALGFFAVEYLLNIGQVNPPLWFANISPVRALPTFCLGILISRCYQLVRIPGAQWIGFALFILAIGLMTLHVGTYPVLALFAGTVFVTANSYTVKEESFLDHRLCLELGNASYSLYMLHAIFLTVAVDFLWPHTSSAAPTLAYGAAMGAVLIAISLITFHIFERPARDFISGRFKRIAPHDGQPHFSKTRY